MTLPAMYPTRTLALLMLAAFAGVALWLFAPRSIGSSTGSQSGNGGNASAAVPASLKVDGDVTVDTRNNVVTRLVVPLAVRGNESIALGDDAGKLRAETAMSDSASAAVPATYNVTWLGGNGDHVLDPGEHALLTVILPAASSVHPNNPLRLVIAEANGANLVIEDVLGR